MTFQLTKTLFVQLAGGFQNKSITFNYILNILLDVVFDHKTDLLQILDLEGVRRFLKTEYLTETQRSLMDALMIEVGLTQGEVKPVLLKLVANSKAEIRATNKIAVIKALRELSSKDRNVMAYLASISEGFDKPDDSCVSLKTSKNFVCDNWDTLIHLAA